MSGALSPGPARARVEIAPPGVPPRLSATGEAAGSWRGPAGEVRWVLQGGDLAQSDQRIVWVAGHLRQPDGQPLSARALLEGGVCTEDDVDPSRFTGNGFVLALSSPAAGPPRFLAYATFFSVPQLYVTRRADGAVFLATDVRDLVPVLDGAEVDAAAVPLHFLFRFVPWRGTYLRGVERLFAGERLRGGLARPFERRRLVDLTFPEDARRRQSEINDSNLDALDRVSTVVVGNYLAAFTGEGRPFGNLLSGGIDSSLLQSWIGDHLPAGRRARSYSFGVPEAPTFAFETDWALEASRDLGTEHTVVSVAPSDYPDLLRRAIHATLQPTLFNETWACHVALAERLGPDGWKLLAGNGADSVHGLVDLIEVARARRLSRFLGLRGLLRLTAPLARRVRPLWRRVEPWVDAARLEDDPASLRSPTDRIELAGELPDVLRAFGPDAARHAFDLRRELADELLPGAGLYERMMVVGLASVGLDHTLGITQIYAAYGVEVGEPFLDQELIRQAFAFVPEIRFFSGPDPAVDRMKPLQRRLLTRRGFGSLASKPKVGTTFYPELWDWMSRGVLRPLVDAIDRPAFLSRRHLDRLVQQPGDFLWNLLIFDLFQKELAALRTRAR